MTSDDTLWHDLPFTNKRMWNIYRKIYDTLTFEDHQMLRGHWYSRLSDQVCFQPEKMFIAFDFIAKKYPDQKLNIVELGCWKGQLAKLILGSDMSDRIQSWMGYDISRGAIADGFAEDDKYQGKVLDKWFHESYIPDCNVFVSSHTFEHMTLKEVVKVMRKVEACGAHAIVLDIPMYAGDGSYVYDWNNYYGGHVLNASRNDVAYAIWAEGYGCSWEIINSKEKAWITVWEKEE